jgi:hypothetical protein
MTFEPHPGRKHRHNQILPELLRLVPNVRAGTRARRWRVPAQVEPPRNGRRAVLRVGRRGDGEEGRGATW